MKSDSKRLVDLAIGRVEKAEPYVSPFSYFA
jgi:hypothetical protein